MATLADLQALGYKAPVVEQDGDGTPIRRIEGFGFSLPLRENDEIGFQSIVDSHPQRVTLQNRATNRVAISAKLSSARDTHRANYANWGSMTMPQKDAANRNAQRTLANLVQFVLDQLDDQGV